MCKVLGLLRYDTATFILGLQLTSSLPTELEKVVAEVSNWRSARLFEMVGVSIIAGPSITSYYAVRVPLSSSRSRAFLSSDDAELASCLPSCVGLVDIIRRLRAQATLMLIVPTKLRVRYPCSHSHWSWRRSYTNTAKSGTSPYIHTYNTLTMHNHPEVLRSESQLTTRLILINKGINI